MTPLLIIKKLFTVLVCFFLSGMLLLVFCNAVLRYGFQSSIPESEELARYFFVWTSFLGIVAAYAKNSHVGVNLLSEKLKGTSKRVLTFISFVLESTAFIAMFIGGLNYVETIGGAKGQGTGIPMAAVASAILFASAAMMMILIYKTFLIKSEDDQQKREG